MGARGAPAHYCRRHVRTLLMARTLVSRFWLLRGVCSIRRWGCQQQIELCSGDTFLEELQALKGRGLLHLYLQGFYWVPDS